MFCRAPSIQLLRFLPKPDGCLKGERCAAAAGCGFDHALALPQRTHALLLTSLGPEGITDRWLQSAAREPSPSMRELESYPRANACSHTMSATLQKRWRASTDCLQSLAHISVTFWRAGTTQPWRVGSKAREVALEVALVVLDVARAGNRQAHDDLGSSARWVSPTDVRPQRCRLQCKARQNPKPMAASHKPRLQAVQAGGRRKLCARARLLRSPTAAPSSTSNP
jgi:hypothetical protein